MLASGIQMAVLHGEERLANLEVASDVDVVADLPVEDILHAAHLRWAERGLYPIILWPYDVGGTGSIFLANAEATEGVQIDILHDIEGRGQYGYMTAALLEHTVPGQVFPRLDAEATEMYVARKRQVKGRETSHHRSFGELARQLLSHKAARELLDSRRTRRGDWPSRWRRLLDRLRRPVGAWIHIAADDADASSHAAEVLAGRMSRYLPHVALDGLQPFPARLWWWARQVAPVRWRPGVFISWATRPGPTPWGCDIVIDDLTDADIIAARVVGELQARLSR